MSCPRLVTFARISNSVLLGMGGYSFGYELGESFDTSPVLLGFLFSLLFLFNSIYVRRKCEQAGYPR